VLRDGLHDAVEVLEHALVLDAEDGPAELGEHAIPVGIVTFTLRVIAAVYFHGALVRPRRRRSVLGSSA
jgi:hypothetical protein